MSQQATLVPRVIFSGGLIGFEPQTNHGIGAKQTRLSSQFLILADLANQLGILKHIYKAEVKLLFFGAPIFLNLETIF